MVDDSSEEIQNDHRRKVRLVIKSSGAFIERRCKSCDRLLMKEMEKSQRSPGSIEILCHKCKELNKI